MAENNPTLTSVYRYYDRFGILIYVGITSRAIRRQREHNDDKDWWQYVVRQEVDHFPTRPDAERRERELIRRHRPPFNKQHNVDWQAMQSAYFTFIVAAETPEEAVATLAKKGGRIRAVVESTNCILTSVGDAVLLSGVDVPIGAPVLARRGQQMCKVKAVDTRGPLLAITVTNNSLNPETPVDLVIKWVGISPADRRLTLKEIRLRKKEDTAEEIAAKADRAEQKRRKELLRGRGKVVGRWWSFESIVDYILQPLLVSTGHTVTVDLTWTQDDLFGEVA